MSTAKSLAIKLFAEPATRAADTSAYQGTRVCLLTSGGLIKGKIDYQIIDPHLKTLATCPPCDESSACTDDDFAVIPLRDVTVSPNTDPDAGVLYPFMIIFLDHVIAVVKPR